MALYVCSVVKQGEQQGILRCLMPLHGQEPGCGQIFRQTNDPKKICLLSSSMFSHMFQNHLKNDVTFNLMKKHAFWVDFTFHVCSQTTLHKTTQLCFWSLSDIPNQASFVQFSCMFSLTLLHNSNTNLQTELQFRPCHYSSFHFGPSSVASLLTGPKSLKSNPTCKPNC